MRHNTLLSIGVILLTSQTILLANESSLTGLPYAGVALSWDHMMGGRDDKLKNSIGNSINFGSGSSLSTEELSGQLFFGTSYKLGCSTFFIGPEIQIGRGMLTSQSDKSVGDPDFLVGPSLTPLVRQLNPSVSRQFASSFVVRSGSNLDALSQLYGLAGMEVSRFKYGFSYQNIDNTGPDPIITGSQRYKISKWGTAPVVGLGIERKIKNVKIGLEYRVAFYRRLKFSRSIITGLDTESVSANFKPRISSVMLRLSYIF